MSQRMGIGRGKLVEKEREERRKGEREKDSKGEKGKETLFDLPRMPGCLAS